MIKILLYIYIIYVRIWVDSGRQNGATEAITQIMMILYIEQNENFVQDSPRLLRDKRHVVAQTKNRIYLMLAICR